VYVYIADHIRNLKNERWPPYHALAVHVYLAELIESLMLDI